MLAQLDLPSASVDQIVEQILTTRRMTRADQRCFMAAALAQNALGRQDQIQIDRLVAALNKGFLKVVD